MPSIYLNAHIGRLGLGAAPAPLQAPAADTAGETCQYMRASKAVDFECELTKFDVKTGYGLKSRILSHQLCWERDVFYQRNGHHQHVMANSLANHGKYNLRLQLFKWLHEPSLRLMLDL